MKQATFFPSLPFRKPPVPHPVGSTKPSHWATSVVGSSQQTEFPDLSPLVWVPVNTQRFVEQQQHE
jgi:hypothetical protein